MTYAQSGNTILPDFSYYFDAASNILTKKFEHRSGTPSEAYNYDTLHRLTRTNFGQRTSTPYEGFIYDDLGNHLTQNDNGTQIAGLFNSVNEQTKRGGVDVLYDKNGNLTKGDASGGGQLYFYDRQNMLTRVEKPADTLVASYSYDAFNRRIEKDVDGGVVTRFYWNGWQTIEETDDAGTPAVQRYYVWGNYIDELLMFRDVAGVGGTANADYFTCRHHNFNIVGLLNSSGAVVERYDYNPYGKRFVLDTDYSADTDGLSDFGLTIGHQGLMHDEESGLVYNRYRMLHIEFGRFMQRDPLGYIGGMSLYQLVRSFVITRVDPMGRYDYEFEGNWTEEQQERVKKSHQRVKKQVDDLLNQIDDYENGLSDCVKEKMKDQLDRLKKRLKGISDGLNSTENLELRHKDLGDPTMTRKLILADIIHHFHTMTPRQLITM